jgi:hypothetical protein
MGYESRFNYEFSSDIKIRNIEELNKKISELDSGMGDATIEEIINSDSVKDGYDIEMDGYYGKFYDSEEFAELLSKYIVRGSVDLIYTGEDGGIEAIRVYPDKTETLECVFVPESISNEVSEYIKQSANKAITKHNI